MRLCSRCGKTSECARPQCPFCLHEPVRLDGHLAFAPELAENSEGFKADFFDRLAQAEAGSFWFRSRNRLINWAVRQYYPQAQNLSDIGTETVFKFSTLQ